MSGLSKDNHHCLGLRLSKGCPWHRSLSSGGPGSRVMCRDGERRLSAGRTNGTRLPSKICEPNGAKTKVAAGTYSKMQLTAATQDCRRDPERRADIGCPRIFGAPLVQHGLELSHDILISKRDRCFRHNGTARKAFDQGAEYLLIESVGGFAAHVLRVAAFDLTDGRGVKAPQQPAGGSRKSPSFYSRRDSERVADQRATVPPEITRLCQNGRPAAGAARPHVYTRTRAKSHDLVSWNDHAAPDR